MFNHNFQQDFYTMTETGKPTLTLALSFLTESGMQFKYSGEALTTKYVTILTEDYGQTGSQE